MRSKVHIRPVTVRDTDALTDLLVALNFFSSVRDKTRDGVRRQVEAQLEVHESPSHLLFVAEEGRSILGYAAAHWLPCLFQEGPDGYLSELFVRDEARGRGVGSSLLEAVVEAARGRGCRRLTLVNLRDRDSYARGFYAQRGWTEQPAAARFVYHLEPA